MGETDATKDQVYEQMAKLIRQSFPDGMKVTIAEMLKWGTTA
jgi:trehalose utilization protein